MGAFVMWLLILALVVAPSVQGQSAICVEDNIDYFGHDLQQQMGISSWQKCGQWCQKTDECFAWSWGKDSHPDPTVRRKCFLKTATWASGQKSDTGVISGQKNCPAICVEDNIDYFGHDLQQQMDISSWQKCGQWCQKTAECLAWSWGKDSHPDPTVSRKCFLKTATWANGRKSDTGVISGQKNCPDGGSAYALITRRTGTNVYGYRIQEQIGEISFNYDATHSCTRIHGVIKNLTAGLHGFHIHQYGDLSNGCVSAGGHYNPHGVAHAGPNGAKQHVGDLGNIMASADGVANVDMCVGFVRTGGEFSVVGRAVVVHAKADDLGLGGNAGSLATGNAGARVGCGVIGWTK